MAKELVELDVKPKLKNLTINVDGKDVLYENLSDEQYQELITLVDKLNESGRYASQYLAKLKAELGIE